VREQVFEQLSEGVPTACTTIEEVRRMLARVYASCLVQRSAQVSGAVSDSSGTSATDFSAIMADSKIC
jgi:hypothetical protein